MTSQDSRQATEQVIAAFGGIRPFAKALGAAASTVQAWKQRGSIPDGRRADIVAAAATAGIALDDAVLGRSLGAAPEDGSGPAELERSAPPATRGEIAATRGVGRPALIVATTACLLGLAGIGAPWWLPSAALRLGVPLPAAPGTLAGAVGDDEAVARLATAQNDVMKRLDGLAADLAGGLDAVRAQAAREATETATRAVSALQAETAERVDSRLDELTARVTDLSGADSGVIEALQGRIEAESAALQALRARVDAAADRLNSLSGDLSARPRFDPRDLAALADRLTDVETAVGGLRDDSATAVGRLTRLEKDVAAGSAVRLGDAAGVLATAQLRLAASESRPFADVLAAFERTLKAATGGNPPSALDGIVSRLRAPAGTGAPTRAMLRDGFPAVAREIARADRTGPEDTWVDRTIERLADPIRIRPKGLAVSGDGAPQRAARAEVLVERNDLAGAVALLKDLEGAPAEAAAEWLAGAQARLAVDAAMVDLMDWATGRMAATPAPSN